MRRFVCSFWTVLSLLSGSFDNSEAERKKHWLTWLQIVQCFPSTSFCVLSVEKLKQPKRQQLSSQFTGTRESVTSAFECYILFRSLFSAFFLLGLRVNYSSVYIWIVYLTCLKVTPRYWRISHHQCINTLFKNLGGHLLEKKIRLKDIDSRVYFHAYNLCWCQTILRSFCVARFLISQSDDSSLAWFNAAGILLSLKHAAIERSSRLETYNDELSMKMSFSDHETPVNLPQDATHINSYPTGRPEDEHVLDMRLALGENRKVWDQGPGTQASFSGSIAGESENKCRICNKVYARPSTLRTHMRTHKGEKPFKCQICLKSFTQDANLTAHLRIHSGEKPFKCQVCERRYVIHTGIWYFYSEIFDPFTWQ